MNEMTIIRRDLPGNNVELKILIRCPAETAERLSVDALLNAHTQEVNYVPAHHYQESDHE